MDFESLDHRTLKLLKNGNLYLKVKILPNDNNKVNNKLPERQETVQETDPEV